MAHFLAFREESAIIGRRVARFERSFFTRLRVVAVNLFRNVLIGVLGLALCNTGSEARAGDGFPPNGAWAYGSRPFGYTARGHVGHVRSVGWGRHGSWGGYGWGNSGWSGYCSMRYRAHYGGWHGHHGHYRSVVRGFHTLPTWNAVPAWNWYGPSFYTGYHSSFYFPTHPFYNCGVPASFGLPVYSSYYVAPSLNLSVAPFCDPVIASPSSLFFSAGLPAARSQDAGHVQLADYSAYGVRDYGNSGYGAGGYGAGGYGTGGYSVAELAPQALGEARGVAAAGVPYRVAKPSVVPPLIRRDDSLAAPVQLVSQNVALPLVPEEILNAADDIFRAGGYREAATAYAQLTVRYGASELLYTRRFLAQVANGDVEQAIVVASTAELAGMQIGRNTLPGGSLSGLGLDEETIAMRKEDLAKHAYHLADDADSLFAVASWLHLAGDDERAEVFLARARQLLNTAATTQLEPKIM